MAFGVAILQFCGLRMAMRGTLYSLQLAPCEPCRQVLILDSLSEDIRRPSKRMRDDGASFQSDHELQYGMKPSAYGPRGVVTWPSACSAFLSGARGSDRLPPRTRSRKASVRVSRWVCNR